MCVYVFSCFQLFATPWTEAHKAPLSMGFSRQKYWSGLPFPPPGNLPNPGIEPTSPVALALAGEFFTTVPPGKPHGAPHLTENQAFLLGWDWSTFPGRGGFLN